jgi:hypothetical protein
MGVDYHPQVAPGPDAPPRRTPGTHIGPMHGQHAGCGAAWLARLTGGQEVPGSNPGSPTSRENADNATGILEYTVRSVLNFGAWLDVHLPDL